MFGQNQGGGFRIPPTLIVAAVMAGFALCKYYGQSSVNEITGETQHISMSPEQEIAMGIQSAPEMAQEMGGLSRNQQAAAIVQQVGQKVVRSSAASHTPYQYDFHLLAGWCSARPFLAPFLERFASPSRLLALVSWRCAAFDP